MPATCPSPRSTARSTCTPISTRRWAGSWPSTSGRTRSLREVVAEATDALEEVRARRRAPRLRLPPRRPPPAGDLRARRHACRRRRAARHRHDRRARRRAATMPSCSATFMTFAAPPRRCSACAMADGAVREVGGRSLPWDPDDYVTEQVFVTSDDGTRVPLFLTHRRDVAPERRRSQPGCTATAGSRSPSARSSSPSGWRGWSAAACWRSPRCAVAASTARRGTTRGGWTNKQNVFDDFAACARWLATSGWTDASRIGDPRPLERRAAGRRVPARSIRSCSGPPWPRWA